MDWIYPALFMARKVLDNKPVIDLHHILTGGVKSRVATAAL